MTLPNHQMSGLDSKARKVLHNIFDHWLPSAVMSLTNKIISSCTINNNVTGDLTGAVNLETAQAVTADNNLSNSDFTSSYITLNGTASCDVTNWTPTVGKIYHFLAVTAVTNPPTVTLSSGITWDGTNDTMTMDATGEYLCVICVSATKVKVLANPDSIAFS